MNHRVGHAGCGHLRFQIVGGNFRGGNHDAFFSIEWFLHAAIEKISDVRIFFSLRDAHVLELLLGENIRQNVIEFFRGDQVTQPWPGLVVLRHGHKREILGPRRIVNFLEAGFHQSPRHFPAAIRAKIEKNHRIVVANHSARGRRLSRFIFRHDHRWQHKFIGDALFVTGAHHRQRISALDFRRAVDDRLVRLAHPLPAIVAVHRVVAAGHRRDLAHSVLAHFLLQCAEKFDPAFRRRVASIHKAVHENAFHFIFARHPQ